MKRNILLSIFTGIIIVLSACSASEGTNSTGVAGSFARFAIVDDYLYTVSFDSMNVFDITSDLNPKLVNQFPSGWEIETIFPKDTLLFLGSIEGMIIYDISNGQNPKFVSNYTHIVSCDPVVVEGDFAYITLHSSGNNNRCFRNVNELHILDIQDITNPEMIANYNMTRPLGLGVDGDTLYLCDDGLKIYNVSKPDSIVLLEHFIINANDIIVLKNHIIIVGDDGLYQYKIDNENITLLSKLEICNSNTLP